MFKIMKKTLFMLYNNEAREEILKLLYNLY